jgi:hypothetical protein
VMLSRGPVDTAEFLAEGVQSPVVWPNKPAIQWFRICIWMFLLFSLFRSFFLGLDNHPY